jgi:hypothetical protein
LGGERSVRNASALGLTANVKDDRANLGVKVLIVDEVALLPSVILSWTQIV